MRPQHVNTAEAALRACRRSFFVVGVFSFFVNFLLLTTAIYLMQVFDRVLSSGNRATLAYLTVVAGGAVLVLAVLEVLRSRALGRVSTWLEQRLAPVLLDRSVDEIVGRRYEAGSGLADLALLRSFVGGTGVLTLCDLPWVPVFLAVIYMLHPMLGHVALAGALVLGSLAWANDRFTQAPLKAAGAASRRADVVANSAMRNAEVVDALGLSDGLIRRWAKDGGEAVRLQALAANRSSTIVGISKFVRLFVQIGVIAAGALLVMEQQLTGGAIIAASIIMGRALAPVEQAISNWKHFVQAREAHSRLKASFARLPRRPEQMRLPVPRGHLSAERIVYGFDLDRPPVLKGVSFAIEPGEAIGIVGPSAAGKSTLARLLVGIDKPTAGVVRLDGGDIFAWPRRELGQYIGYLPQDVELFSGTVSENIARLSEMDPDRVVEAARLADCHDLILKLDNGYETELGDSGLKLSGGQRQRIGLARALYGDPKLIVLDEPNANLDGEGEQALYQAVVRAKARGASLIVIGHRPSTLAAVDKVLMLVDGRVERFGPRQEVLEMLGRPKLTTSDAAKSTSLIDRLDRSSSKLTANNSIKDSVAT